jgi:excisionase family DNA binding protein
MPNEFVTIQELSQHLSVSKSTIRGWVRDQKIPPETYIRVGNTYRFCLSDLISALSPKNSQLSIDNDSNKPKEDAENTHYFEDLDDETTSPHPLYPSNVATIKEWENYLRRTKECFYNIEKLADLNQYIPESGAILRQEVISLTKHVLPKFKTDENITKQLMIKFLDEWTSRIEYCLKESDEENLRSRDLNGCILSLSQNFGSDYEYDETGWDALMSIDKISIPDLKEMDRERDDQGCIDWDEELWK